MPLFKYTAMGASGQPVQGQVEAPSRQAALQQLDRDQLQPLALEIDQPAAPPSAVKGVPRLGLSQIILFSEDIADLLEAGLQLEAALRVLEERPAAPALQATAARARKLVREGTPFATALRQASPSFGELYCSMVAAGEASGVLGEMLRRQTAYLLVMQELRAKLQQALVYPAFICAAGGAILVLFMTVLLPELDALFRQTQSQLPWLTRVMIAAAHGLMTWWPVLLLAAAALTWGWRRWTATDAGKLAWGRSQLRLPLAGPLLQVRFYAQFAHTMASLTANGIPLIQALKLTTQATVNRHLRARLERLVTQVGDGASLSRAMKASGVFPQLFVDIVGVGERTGNLARALERAAHRYDREMQQGLTRMMDLIQPSVILGIALGVGLVAYSVVNTILEAVSSLKVQL